MLVADVAIEMSNYFYSLLKILPQYAPPGLVARSTKERLNRVS
jgi:hypothetical protein